MLEGHLIIIYQHNPAYFSVRHDQRLWPLVIPASLSVASANSLQQTTGKSSSADDIIHRLTLWKNKPKTFYTGQSTWRTPLTSKPSPSSSHYTLHLSCGAKLVVDTICSHPKSWWYELRLALCSHFLSTVYYETWVPYRIPEPGILWRYHQWLGWWKAPRVQEVYAQLHKSPCRLPCKPPILVFTYIKAKYSQHDIQKMIDATLLNVNHLLGVSKNKDEVDRVVKQLVVNVEETFTHDTVNEIWSPSRYSTKSFPVCGPPMVTPWLHWLLLYRYTPSIVLRAHYLKNFGELNTYWVTR